MPRARLADEAGEQEWKSALLPAYKRLSRRAEALIAEAYLAGMNTRRVRRALAKLFEGHIGKDVVSRAWQKTRAAWQAWQERDLAGDDIVRLILDGTVVKVRLDRKATAISLLIALGIRRDGQKVVLAIRNMGGESEAAWRAVLDDLTSRGLARPELGMAAKASRRRSPACGTTSQCSAVPCTRSATCSRTRPTICTTRSRPSSTTWSMPTVRPRFSPGARRFWPGGSCAVAPSPTAWRNPASACSPSCATRPSMALA